MSINLVSMSTLSKNTIKTLICLILQVEIDLESVRVQLEEESEARLDLERQLVKSNGEVAQWRSKYESEASARAEEIEELRRKYSIRIQEQEEQIETLIVKINNIEKQKSRLQSEVILFCLLIYSTLPHGSKFILLCQTNPVTFRCILHPLS